MSTKHNLKKYKFLKPLKNSRDYWYWLTNFFLLLDESVEKLEKAVQNSHKDKEDDNANLIDLAAELRLAERVFNFYIDLLMLEIEKSQNMSISAYLEKEFGKQGIGLWRDLKNRRDKIADRISTLLESDKKALGRYYEFCENLKQYRQPESLFESRKNMLIPLLVEAIFKKEF